MLTRFAAALKRENLTQGDVARALGIKRQSVNEWATGRRPVPPDRFLALEMAFPGRFTRERDLKSAVYKEA